MAPKRKAPSTGADGSAKAAADSPAKKAKAPAGSATKPRPKKARKKLRYTVRKKSARKTVDAVKKPDKAEHADESAEPEKKTDNASEHVTVATAEAVSKRLIIEHCKQCTSFKNQAAKFEKSLKEKIEGLEVSINPDKPRRGCFEVRDAEGNAFLTLLDLKRPFPELKALNVEEEVAIIVSKFKE